mgnify:CR=1 FL=1
MDRRDDDRARTRVVQVVHDAVRLLARDHRSDGRPLAVVQRGDGRRLEAGRDRHRGVDDHRQVDCDAVTLLDAEAAQRIAYNRALAAAKKALTQETITFIKETFGDLDSYLKPMIEAQVRSQKTYM